MPTEMEDYLFDLRGYLVIKNALHGAELDALNAIVDRLSPSSEQEAERAEIERAAAVASVRGLRLWKPAGFQIEESGIGHALLGGQRCVAQLAHRHEGRPLLRALGGGALAPQHRLRFRLGLQRQPQKVAVQRVHLRGRSGRLMLFARRFGRGAPARRQLVGGPVVRGLARHGVDVVGLALNPALRRRQPPCRAASTARR